MSRAAFTLAVGWSVSIIAAWTCTELPVGINPDRLSAMEALAAAISIVSFVGTIFAAIVVAIDEAERSARR
jgi:hypothetical protein